MTDDELDDLATYVLAAIRAAIRAGSLSPAVLTSL